MDKQADRGRAEHSPTISPQIETDGLTVAEAKAAWRPKLLDQRAAITARQRQADDDARQAAVWQLLHEEGYLKDGRTVDALTVAIYLSLPSEPGTLGLARDLDAAGARLLVPAVVRGASRMPAWSWYETPLTAGWHDIPISPGEVLGAEVLAQCDLIVMPGLAGGLNGQRLGLGAAWYDRALAFAPPEAPRWLLLDNAAIFDDVPHEAHDQRVDRLIAPSAIVVCPPRNGRPQEPLSGETRPRM